MNSNNNQIRLDSIPMESLEQFSAVLGEVCGVMSDRNVCGMAPQKLDSQLQSIVQTQKAVT